jgi:hypothetical protein
MVYFDNENNRKGLGRIIVQIFNQQGVKVAETQSESDGYFSYLGLKPGSYTLQLDPEQLNKLNYQSAPLQHNTVIKELVDGDIVDGLEFVLQAKITTSEADGAPMEIVKMARIKTNTINNKEKTKVEQKSRTKTQAKASGNTSFQNVTEVEGLFYSVQIGVYKNKVSAKQLLNLSPIYFEVLPNGTTQYICGKYASRSEAKTAKKAIVAKGIKGAFVVTYRNGKKLALVSQETDSSLNKDITEVFDFVITKTNE